MIKFLITLCIIASMAFAGCSSKKAATDESATHATEAVPPMDSSTSQSSMSADAHAEDATHGKTKKSSKKKSKKKKAMPERDAGSAQ